MDFFYGSAKEELQLLLTTIINASSLNHLLKMCLATGRFKVKTSTVVCAISVLSETYLDHNLQPFHVLSELFCYLSYHAGMLANSGKYYHVPAMKQLSCHRATLSLTLFSVSLFTPGLFFSSSPAITTSSVYFGKSVGVGERVS